MQVMSMIVFYSYPLPYAHARCESCIDVPVLAPLGYWCVVRGNDRGGGKADEVGNVHDPDCAGGEGTG